MTAILGYPAAVTLRENTPQTQDAGVGFTRPFRRVKPPLRSEKSFRFFRLRLQGVTHYTLPCKEPCARRSLWTPLWQGYALLSYALRLRIKEWRRDGCGSCEGVSQKHRHHRHDRHAENKSDSHSSRQGYPKTAVITVTVVTQRAVTRRRKEDDE